MPEFSSICSCFYRHHLQYYVLAFKTSHNCSHFFVTQLLWSDHKLSWLIFFFLDFTPNSARSCSQSLPPTAIYLVIWLPASPLRPGSHTLVIYCFEIHLIWYYMNSDFIPSTCCLFGIQVWARAHGFQWP